MLTALGLDQEHDNVYRYLVSGMPATCEEVRTAMGLRLARARAALARLEEVGFVYRLAGDPVRFAAASPGAVDAAIARKMAELRQAQESLGQIASRYRARRLAEDGTGVFEVIRGAEALREAMLDMLSSAHTEALNMVKPPVIAVHSEEHMRPGGAVRGRLIFDRDAVGDARTLDAIRQNLDAHAEIRVHPKVPVKMLAIDRKVALVPLVQHDAGAPLGVMIGESAVLDSVLALFDFVWETAVRLHVGNIDSPRPAGKSPLREADRQLLSLLLAGLTDEAIAAHFKISVRTVERKARALMDAAHVRTRMQLAWEAARQSWV
jgi:sugar-specific transcriptional regulator TrmB/DNA-binding CsgD family transcriptional regulator